MATLRPMLSRLKTACYRRPREELSRLRRWGPKAYFNLSRWQREMEEAAERLPTFSQSDEALPAKNASPLEVWFMTGARFWYQTAFCLFSLCQQSRMSYQANILDDGTLKEGQAVNLHRIFPHCRVISLETRIKTVEETLPVERYPTLHHLRRRQPLFRKLVDLHHDSSEWRFFLDSDILFFHPPNELMEHLEKGERPLFQKDCWESYGYSRSLCESLTGRNLPKALNIGVFSLRGDQIDWDEVEEWTSQMIALEGYRYNITQCTVAMIASRLDITVLDANQYRVYPDVTNLPDTTSALQHYVADSKPYYFGEAWRGVVD